MRFFKFFSFFLATALASVSFVSCGDDDKHIVPDVIPQGGGSGDAENAQFNKELEASIQALMNDRTGAAVVTGPAFYVSDTLAYIPCKLNVDSTALPHSAYGLIFTDKEGIELTKNNHLREFNMRELYDPVNLIFLVKVDALVANTLYRYRGFYTYGTTYQYGIERQVRTPAPAVLTCEYVDLGLSVKWGRWNLGAVKPYQIGTYYAYGDPTGLKKPLKASDCPSASVLGTELDPATAILGDGWKMPSVAQMRELINNCTWTVQSQAGFTGYDVKGPSGKSIFLPLCGYINYGISDLATSKDKLYIWSGEASGAGKVSVLNVSNSNGLQNIVSNVSSYWCMPIRPVHD